VIIPAFFTSMQLDNCNIKGLSAVSSQLGAIRSRGQKRDNSTKEVFVMTSTEVLDTSLQVFCFHCGGKLEIMRHTVYHKCKHCKREYVVNRDLGDTQIQPIEEYLSDPTSDMTWM
jgi:hypothetical protein